jgi:hypothetical protein
MKSILYFENTTNSNLDTIALLPTLANHSDQL